VRSFSDRIPGATDRGDCARRRYPCQPDPHHTATERAQAEGPNRAHDVPVKADQRREGRSPAGRAVEKPQVDVCPAETEWPIPAPVGQAGELRLRPAAHTWTTCGPHAAHTPRRQAWFRTTAAARRGQSNCIDRATWVGIRPPATTRPGSEPLENRKVGAFSTPSRLDLLHQVRQQCGVSRTRAPVSPRRARSLASVAPVRSGSVASERLSGERRVHEPNRNGSPCPSTAGLMLRAGKLANLLVGVVKAVGDRPTELFRFYPNDLFGQGVQRIEAGLGIVVPTQPLQNR
jgi:hypothetical protein